mmetsp:Transcript_41148/g.47444  ORF Transcript_41148/g.47444 Transcript_41148/m.47444 type:complete len:176 (+) Transcript_41148:192-719(+)|eukprot:CAMPEP_0114977436 /NCGR_PEP_ID=MMETSP0216-20121206/3236_1 /TAXON_ID=223996 /ORGANISM="Protocruzia adherens, Strain Boccale" /LENGTH=175 /DNA_ID=CAMNT_0002338493 /DNA_START=152 /DNA_END=679 /DNA_ORIENTATION=+
MGTFVGNQFALFPFNLAYGPTNYWVRWSIYRTGNDYNLWVGGLYLLDTGAANVVSSSTQTPDARIYFEDQGTGWYKVRSSRGRYLNFAGAWQTAQWLPDSSTDNALFYFPTSTNPALIPALLSNDSNDSDDQPPLLDIDGLKGNSSSLMENDEPAKLTKRSFLHISHQKLAEEQK